METFRAGFQFGVGDTSKILISTAKIPELIKEGKLTSVVQKVTGWKGEDARELFYFNTHGFEFLTLSKNISEILSKIEMDQQFPLAVFPL